jgi:hypothetical protein
MTDLSPAAQAVLNAAYALPLKNNRPSIAAALRAAADQVVPDVNHPLDTRWHVGYADGCGQNRQRLLVIAAELEGANG